MIASMTDASTKSDFELAELAQKGDELAYGALLERHYSMMYKVAYTRVGDKQDAQDVAQEVCIKLASAIAQYRFDSAFTTWLYRIIINTAQDYIRARGTSRKYETSYVQEQQFEEAPKNQEDHIVATEVMAAIRRLPDKIRDAVMLVIVDGLNHAEASKVLGISEGTVSWRISEAKKHLKRFFE
jgi:RNA polymerase sigma-70 factor (ECF subfamily)